MSLATQDGKLHIVAGSSRCGKTTETVKMVKPFKVVFVWDIEAQWSKLRGFTRVSSLAELKRIAIDGKAGRWCYVSNGNIKAEFEMFCMCAYHYGRYFGECAVVAEELADVTTTSKAADAWGILCRRGLKRAITIFAISQRWAEADKTAFGNATDYYVFIQSSVDDVIYISRKTRVKVNEIEALEKFEFIHYDKDKRLAIQKRVTF